MVLLVKKFLIAVLSLLAAVTLSFCSGCDFSTVIVTDADAPDETFVQFVDALKKGDYETADRFLAENATIKPENGTGYGFFDEYAAVSLEQLVCKPVGTPAYDGVNATLSVNVTSLDKKGLLQWLQENLNRIEHEYMLENNLLTIDTQNREEVDKVLSRALKEYASIGEKSSEQITVSFVFEEGRWKIIGDDALVSAVFGGVTDEE